MLRRRHKKSYGGCVQCKKRHVKCDQQRPTCILCSMSSRECSYATDNTSSASTGPPVGISPSTSIATPISPSLPSTLPTPLPTHSTEEAINFQHMELVTHLITDSTLLGLGDSSEPYHVSISLALQTGLTAPYLLYELLAFSARHLQYLNRGLEKEELYSRQATALQTRAIGLFNSEKITVHRDNCIAVCLFSVVLGHHLLTDTLGHHDNGHSTLAAFLEKYLLCLETLKGVFTITMTGWPLLMETYLAPALSRSRSFTSSEPTGTECYKLQQIIAGSKNLTPSEKRACLTAIKYLQLGFDALSHSGDKTMRYQMLFLWTVVVPQEFTSLLAAKRSESLVILAYHAALLCHGRHVWQVGEAGKLILSMIREFLPGEWDRWLPQETELPAMV